MTQDVLRRAGIQTRHCASNRSIANEVEQGAGALLIAEEALSEEGADRLVEALMRQPPWSDLPVLVLARQGANSSAIVDAMDLPANVTVLERPMRVAALITALRSALRARRRQYELCTLLDDLRESDQRKTEFLATLAHELRNPMAPLLTSLAILRRINPDGDATTYYDVMGRQLDHMVRLVNDLMEVSRVTRAQIELQLETLPVDSVIQGAVELSRPSMDAARHRLEIHPADAPLLVRGDRVRLTQVFSNLINNAARYTPEGGHIQVWVERAGDRAVVRVEDNGVGIPPDMLESVFGMFVQVTGAARAAQGGLGIGLTLVRSLVELHGGTVRAHSEGIGHGTRIEVTLPLQPDGHAASPTESRPECAATLSQNILIVDDNRDAADSLATVLELLGAKTRVAYDGEEALRIAARIRPEIAILDIGMPRMDGYELARKIRRNPEHKGIVLVALSGWGQADTKQRLSDAGFDLHLLKPIDIGRLSTLLERAAGPTP
jgi:signal transduction histidine kinase/CheY-like chemotaxis protein